MGKLLAAEQMPLPTNTLRLVLVDDDDLQRKLAGVHLEAAGFAVEAYTNAGEALVALKNSPPPDAILSDVVMGDMDGFAFCATLRQESRFRRVPIVLVSAAFDEAGDHALAREVGASALVSRSPSFRQAIEALRRGLSEGVPHSGIVPTGPRSRRLYVERVSRGLHKLQRSSVNAAEHYRLLFENASDIFLLLTPRGIIYESNGQLEKRLELPRGSAVGCSIGDFVAEDAAFEAMTRLSSALAEDDKVELPLQHANGTARFVELSICRTTIDGQVTVLAVGRDITELRTAQTELAERERRYRTLVESVPEVVFSANAAGKLSFISANVRDVYGFTAEEMIANVDDLQFARIHPEDRTRFMAARERLLQFGEPLDFEGRWNHPNGNFVWIHWRARATRTEHGELCIDGLFSDVSSRKSLEEQLCQAQKIEAVGQLSAGIAHDFNNILAIILASAQFLQDGTQGEPAAEALADIEQASKRAQALTEQLLAFSRRTGTAVAEVDANEVVRGVTRLLGRVLRRDITLDTKLTPSLRRIRVDAGQLEQVLMNLGINARDAMPNGGRLALSTAEVRLDDSDTFLGCRFRGSHPRPGRYVLLSVSDTGSGIDAATLERIFEPFFTTKREHGTGLGLSTSYGIVRKYGGHLCVETEPGVGTTFHVFFPEVRASS